MSALSPAASTTTMVVAPLVTMVVAPVTSSPVPAAEHEVESLRLPLLAVGVGRDQEQAVSARR
jgi:hypothetical protein